MGGERRVFGKNFLMKSDGTVAGAVKRGLYCS